MNVGAVFYVIGRLCTLLAFLLAAPLALCLAYGGLGTEVANAFIVTGAISLGLGWALRLSFEFEPKMFGTGEAFATVTLTWVVFTGLGALPFLITNAIPSVVNACFEVLSGFTTTGASILDHPSELSEPLLFWRAMTQWIGGLGIVAMSVAILPALGAGGNFLFQAEMPGPENEKLLPRISSTAKLLWTVYLLLTVTEFIALWAAGMSPFDAVCHTFATVSSGGFGTRDDSMTSFSPTIQWIITAYMFLAGVNFVMLLSALRGRPMIALRNTELRVYLGLTLLVIATICFVRWDEPGVAEAGFEPLLRGAAFTTTTLFTSTGFVSENYELWPPILHAVLIMVMLIGACAGSTGGGSKVIRVIVAAKAGVREIRRLLRPSAVFVLKVGGRPVNETIVAQTIGYFLLYLAALSLVAIVMMATGETMMTSTTAAITCLSNMGPGLDAVGPDSNFENLTYTAKILLMGCMLLGRLEFYSVLVLLLPMAWRR